MSRQSLSPGRLEAFSDGVIAVIITIMVLELKVPAQDGVAGVRVVLPTVCLYLLTFVQVGIYWVNHHYLVDEVETVSHGILWANLIFLFFLSLFPFVTDWIGMKGLSSFSTALYAGVSILPGLCTWRCGFRFDRRVLRLRMRAGASRLRRFRFIFWRFRRLTTGRRPRWR